MTRSLELGTVVAHYRILSALGAGGMGEVYLARDESLGRSVALKVLPPELVKNEERVRRFIQEAKAASSLSHAHIVTIHEIGETEVRSDETPGRRVSRARRPDPLHRDGAGQWPHAETPPGGDGLRGQPDGDVTAADQGPIVGGPVLNVILRLVLWMDSRLHPSSLLIDPVLGQIRLKYGPR